MMELSLGKYELSVVQPSLDFPLLKLFGNMIVATIDMHWLLKVKHMVISYTTCQYWLLRVNIWLLVIQHFMYGKFFCFLPVFFLL